MTRRSRKARSCVVEAREYEDPVDKLLRKYSCWYSLKRTVAWILRCKKWLQDRRSGLKHWPLAELDLDVTELEGAEMAIIRYLQGRYFEQELCTLETKGVVKMKSPIYCLEPFRDNEGLLRLGGRLLEAPISDRAKHPVILPRDHHVTELIVRNVHQWKAGHSGKEHVLSLVRQRYWIPKARPLVNRVLQNCVICKKLRGMPGVQKMADLPMDRTMPGKPPFTYVGMDCFGPFYIKRGRSQVKRYGCLFTCLTIRAIHIEKLDTLDTDSFLNALMRFSARRGTPDKVRSDNGTNFVGGQRELRQAVRSWKEDSKVKGQLLQKEIKWEFNPPAASHMGGVWERQIWTVRKVLNAIIKNQTLDDERLATLFCEVESIVNDRPLTYVSDNPRDPESLTPNHLLLLRAGPGLAPGKFQKEDIYGKRWRHVQYLADQFGKRWIREYLPTLQLRRKWIQPKRNLTDGDIVLVMDVNTPRKCWPLGRVIRSFPGKDGLVRSVEVKTSWAVFTRPVNKLCLLDSVNTD